ncbi:hypothetical protein APHAL10511_005832 [Amanita phalloides]|nr:hypothetical protein APHAL10511_005832 [Amanita phalloides]
MADQSYPGGNNGNNSNGGNGVNASGLDVLFLQDFTGSQQPYIDKARAQIHTICTTLTTDGNFAPGGLRFGVVAFRDHVPQDSSFVTKALTPVPNSNPPQVTFTTDPSVVASVLNTLTAAGGGDGPEASADALQMAVQANWNANATKVTILITDAPPHGLGETGDGFPDGCPLQIEPQRMAKSMARIGITLYVIACEPTLSSDYKQAHAFYEGITATTGGKVYELGDSINLQHFIRAAAVETIDQEAIVSRHGDAVRSLISQNANASNAEIAKKLQAHFAAQNVQMRTLNFDRIVEESSVSDAARVWFETDTLAQGRARIHHLGSGASSRIRSHYSAGGSQPAPTISNTPISFHQIQGIVQKVRMR